MNKVADTPLLGSGAIQSKASPTYKNWKLMVGGSALAAYGLSRRSLFGSLLAVAGGGLAYFGNGSGAVHERESHGTVLLNCSPEEAFRFWRDLENLPRFMKFLSSVSVLDPQHSRWVIRGPLGRDIVLQSEIVNESENEFIAWRTLPGSDLVADGEVDFLPEPSGRGTVLTAKMHLSIPGGTLGRAISKIMGKDATFMMMQDLRRLKALIESGEIPTTEGQSHGPRSLLTGAARMINPAEPAHRGVHPVQDVQEQRRAS